MDEEIKIIESNSKEDLVKQFKRLKNSFKVIDYSLATSTKYSKFRDEEYTVYTLIVRYECPEPEEYLL